MERNAGTSPEERGQLRPAAHPAHPTRPLPQPLPLLLFGLALLIGALAGGWAAGPGTPVAQASAPDLTATPTPTATACAGANAIQNGGFESGTLDPWVIDGFAHPPAVSTVTPHSGQYDVLVGTLTGPEPTGNSSLYQQITVPAGGAILSFWYWGYCGGCDSDSIVFDVQEALVTDTADNVLVTALYAQENSFMWKYATYDLSSLAGMTVRIKFLVTQDGFGDDTALYVDDVMLQPPASCGSATPTPTGTPPTATPTACAPAWGLAAHYPLVADDVAVAAQGAALYAFGGSPAGYGAQANAYKFDGSTWQPIAPLPDNRAAASAVSDGTYLYILGGWDSSPQPQPTNTLFRYDPATDTYTTLAPYSINTARQSAAYVNGTIYRIGGCTGSNCYNNWQTNTVDAFTISTGTWAPVAPYPLALGGIMAVGWNGSVYAAGGWTATISAKTYRYDPVANYWDDGAVADLPATRAFGASTVVAGRWLLAGGVVDGMISAQALTWDPASNQWTDLSPMLLPRIYLQGGTLGSAFYAVGGGELNYPASSTNQRYPVVDCPTETPTPPATATPSATAMAPGSPTPTATPTPCAPDIVQNGGFEDGTWSPWVLGGTWAPTIRTVPHSGSYSALLGSDQPGITWSDNSLIYQQISVPAAGGILSFWFYPHSEDSILYDWQDAYVTDLSGTILATILHVSANTQIWTHLIFDMAPYAGQTVRIEFLVHQDGEADFTYMYLDDVALLPPCDTATPTVGPGTSTPSPPATASNTPLVTTTALAPTQTLGPTNTPCSAGFSDVHPSDYFYTPVLALACRGVIAGYADGTFRPYAGTTRAQMVKIVVLGFGRPITTPTGDYTFADVPPAFPFFSVIETAAANGIVGGYGCGGPGEPCDPQRRPYFRPYANVTRGQLSKIVVAAAGWSLGNPPTATFADVPPGSAFYPFVETAASHGVISGYTCGGPGEPCDPAQRPYFRPGAGATRGQIAKIVYLALTGAAWQGPQLR